METEDGLEVEDTIDHIGMYWLVGLSFLGLSVFLFPQSKIGALLCAVDAGLFLPPVRKIMFNKFSMKLHRIIRALLAISILALALSVSAFENTLSLGSPETQNTEIGTK